MKFFVIVSALLVVCKAGVLPGAPAAIIAEPLVRVAVPFGSHASQYHSQDAIGQYTYGYSNELSAKNEIRTADGQTAGAYSYVDAEGKVQHVQYRADPIHGFRALATNLPVAPDMPQIAPAIQLEPVRDTPEVIEARAKHLEAVHRAEEDAKKSHESAAIARSAIHAHPSSILPASSPAGVVRAAPLVDFIHTSPILASPSFGYSYGINYGGGLYSYSINPQPIITAYAAPGHLIAAPVIASSSLAASNAQALPEAPKDLPEVVEARAKHLAAVESIKKDIENEQQHQGKE